MAFVYALLLKASTILIAGTTSKYHLTMASLPEMVQGRAIGWDTTRLLEPSGQLAAPMAVWVGLEELQA